MINDGTIEWNKTGADWNYTGSTGVNGVTWTVDTGTSAANSYLASDVLQLQH